MPTDALRTSRERSAIRMIRLRGELDVGAATSVLKRLLELDLRPGQRLIVDLRELEFMDSTGVRVLLKALDRAHCAGAAFTLVAGPPSVMRVLDLLGLREQLDVIAEP
ncbi:MAG TPA: STAS domain-containing protein [Solirubrobacteraceae bacterium]|nr:STAS domain-containing protein [Solirubrobacteraceae bacterium]